jgi:hypothetical protein
VSTRAEIFDAAMRLQPGIVYGKPDAFLGTRPVYFTDGAAEQLRLANNAWFKDPEGISGPQSDFAISSLSAVPSGTPPWDTPEPWLLPAYTGNPSWWQTPGQAAALEAKFGTADSNAANRVAMEGPPLFTLTPPPAMCDRCMIPEWNDSFTTGDTGNVGGAVVGTISPASLRPPALIYQPSSVLPLATTENAVSVATNNGAPVAADHSKLWWLLALVGLALAART